MKLTDLSTGHRAVLSAVMFGNKSYRISTEVRENPLRVQTKLQFLKRHGLVIYERSLWYLTPAGRALLAEARDGN